ncbi:MULTISPECIES: LIC_12616 family protein [unclassified Rhizobium]|uniref:phage neck terminator protein n=1 Tax=unclassified Rhizobium TaxID=2613769 RepID=UPI0037FF78E2
MTDSSTGGFLAPTSPPPAADDALDDQIQAAVVGITGLNGTLVRPRWQPSPPKQPPATTNWCAIGVVRLVGDTYAWIGHHPDGNGYDEMQRHVTFDVLASFYGPNGQAYAGLLRDGLQIPQNREALYLQGIAFVEASEIIAAPALINEQWVRKYDLTVTLRTQITRTYAVLNLLSASGSFITQTSTQPWETPA